MWMFRLGEFFQRRVSQAAAAVAPVLERPRATRAIPSPPPSWATPRDQALFTPEAEQVMQQWPQRAPLLHGLGTQGHPQTSLLPQQQLRDPPSSTGSLTQEQVLAEVHKQVQRAMQGHQQEMRALEEENQRLRAQMQRRGEVPETTLQPDLRRGNPVAHPGGEVQRAELRGQAVTGPLREPTRTPVNQTEASEVRGHVAPPPGLEGQQGEDAGHRGPTEVHGGDPLGVRHGQEGIDGNPPDVQGDRGKALSGTKGLEQGAYRSMASADQAATTDEGGGRGTTKGPMEAFGMLAQGIAQLQMAMSATMTHRAQELEVVKPGISELPKLPELSETSCIDIGDWIHSLQCPMGDLSNGSSGWWKETQQCLDRFYNTYLESSNLVKLTLKPETFATAYLKEEKWTRVDKRATSMILSSLPDTVRAEVLALRLTGTLAVLGRVMVLYRPGSAAERQQILKALESPSTATSATEAVDMLRRWARWLRRAGDVGLRCPDASVLLRGLDTMTKRALQDHGEIQFRMNMMRYTLEVDSKPTQRSVEDLHHAMLSEFEQVAFRGRTRQQTSSTASASMKAMTATSGAGTSLSTTTADSTGGEGSPGKGKGAPCGQETKTGEMLDLWEQATHVKAVPNQGEGKWPKEPVEINNDKARAGITKFNAAGFYGS
eukprot:s5267_g2.t1